MKSLLSLVFLSLIFTSIFAQDGALDLTFNSTGDVKTSFSSGYDFGKSIAIQSDGKIVIAGNTNGSTYSNFAVSRFNSDGTIDTGFGTNGKVTTPVTSFNNGANSVAIQSDGKIVVAGFASNGSSSDFAVVRYTNSGTLDNTFNSTGIVITPIVSNDDDMANGVAIQPNDQKIVVAGFARLNGSQGGNYDFAVVRYNSDGTLDTGFGAALNGKVTTDFGTPADIGNSVAIHGGKIVVAGYAHIGTTDDFAVARYNSDGTLDNTFNSTGKATTAIGTSTDRGNSVAIQSDEKIVVAGYAHIGSTDDFAVVRYNSDGSLDNTFDSDGKVTTAIGTGSDWGSGVAIQSDGKIVVTGFASMSFNNIALVRYTTTGSLDNTFGNGGKVTTAFGTSGCDGNSIAIQSDGKIVIGGDSYIGYNDADFAVIRYTSTSQQATNLNSPLEGENNHSLNQLDQNFPNPFKSITTIGYYLAKSGFVSMKIYDVFGKEIKALVQDEKEAGYYKIVIDRKDFASGIYYYTLKTADFSESKKMISM